MRCMYMLLPFEEDVIMNKIINKYEIPLSRNNFEALYVIRSFLRFSEDDFDNLIAYLKDRATRDCYNKEITEDTPETSIYDWTFYLQQYQYYIEEILVKAVSWIDRNKTEYLFPEDVYDITYNHVNYKDKIFLKYIGILE